MNLVARLMLLRISRSSLSRRILFRSFLLLRGLMTGLPLASVVSIGWSAYNALPNDSLSTLTNNATVNSVIQTMNVSTGVARQIVLWSALAGVVRKLFWLFSAIFVFLPLRGLLTYYLALLIPGGKSLLKDFTWIFNALASWIKTLYTFGVSYWMPFWGVVQPETPTGWVLWFWGVSSFIWTVLPTDYKHAYVSWLIQWIPEPVVDFMIWFIFEPFIRGWIRFIEPYVPGNWTDGLVNGIGYLQGKVSWLINLFTRR